MKTRNIEFNIILWIFMSCLFLHGQDQVKIDSLLSILNSKPQDTVKIDTYLALRKNWTLVDSTKAMEYFRKAFALSQKIGDERRMAISYLNLSDHLLKTGLHKEANRALEKVKELNEKLKDPEVGALYNNLQGTVYSWLGDYEKAVDHLFLALSSYEVLRDSVGIGQCFTNIGSAYLHLNNYKEALKNYEKGLEIARSINDPKGMANAFGNMGSIYANLKEFEKAMVYSKQSLEINQKSGFLEDTRIDLYNIGRLYRKLEKPDSAMTYFKRAKELAVKIGSKRGMLFADQALAVMERDFGNYSASEKMLDEALPLAEEMGLKEIIQNINLSYSYNYEATKKYKLALEYRKRYEDWYDSLINEKNLNKIKELEINYETEKKDQQITLLDQQKELQVKETQRQATLKNAFIGSLVLITLLAGLIYYTFRQRLKNQRALASKNEEINQVNYKRQLTELEMKALQAQINPHFIFNCLSSINQMILDGDRPNASKYLTKFSKLIRLILENAEAAEVSLKNEVALLEAYIQLESLRFNGNIDHQIEVREGIDLENTYLPAMVLQPFVENAIWHGLIHKKEAGGGQIRISIEQQEDILVCTIEDNGVGRQKAFELQQKSIYKSKSLGLKITEERLRLLGKKIQEQLIKITDLKDPAGQALGTRVTINIPMS